MISPETVEWILIAMAVVIVVQCLWLAYVTILLYRRARTQTDAAKRIEAGQAMVEQKTVIEDIFLLHRSGLLLKHYTRRLRPNVDSDVLSGMLVAVQEFIKDSFKGEKGMLKEIRFGELRIVVMEGKWTIVACLVRGEKVMDVQPQIAAALADVESKYADLLMNWDGTMDAVPEVDVIMRKLISGEYNGEAIPRRPCTEEVLVT